MDVLESSLTGNIIGTLSLILGIISILLTIKTMKTAKRIEIDMKEAKIVALDQNRFNKNKEGYLKKLNAKRRAASKNQVLSYQLCNDVLSIINDIKGYDSIIMDADMGIIEQQWNKLQQISSALRDGKSGNLNLQEFDVVVSTITNILCKGEYEL